MGRLAECLVIERFARIGLGALVVATPAWAAPERFVAVTGSCLRKTAPDRGMLTLTAEFRDPDLRAAIRKATESYERAREGVRKLGLENLELSTSEYRVNEVREWEKDKQVMRGYLARMGLQVETASIARLGEVIVVAAKEGLKDVGSLRTFLSEEKKLGEHVACLKDAAANARAKAERLATALGAQLGKTLSIQEGGASGGVEPEPPRLMMADMAGGREAKMSAPSVDAAAQTFSTTITASFALQ